MWYIPIGDKVTATFGPGGKFCRHPCTCIQAWSFRAFKLGGHGSAFGASTSTIGGLKYVADNGFAAVLLLTLRKGYIRWFVY